MVDIIFVSVPYTQSDEPSMAPALLKGVVTQYGYSSVALDLNIEIVNTFRTHPKKEALIHFFEFAKPRPELTDDVSQIIDYSVARILSYNPKIIALSLLTYKSQIFTLWLLVKLKMVAPNISIVIGGSGIKNSIASSDNTFCEDMLALQLIDYYITGDGEVAILELLKENFQYAGINSMAWQQVLNLDDFAYPDYSDYDFNQYPEKLIPITDSRGCVRACKFCDIIEHWQKYVYRSAESVFKEMLYQIDSCKISSFTMRNSLTNGNTKEFKKLLTFISDYNRSRPYDQQIKWQGYFIVREKTQHPETMFELIQQSNGTLWLGVESVIEHVRHAMGKKFSNIDIDYHLEMTQKYHIPTLLLIMTGNPTETRADYEFTKRWFKERYQYANNSVFSVLLTMASVLPGTEWDRTQDQMNLQVGNYPSIWINQNINISLEERVAYWDELHQICAPYNKNSRPDSHSEDLSQAALAVIQDYLHQTPNG